MRIDRDAPLRFLRAAFLPEDWIAVLLKRYDTGEALQRVGPVAMVLDPRFQSWLRFKNAHQFNVFVSINALTPGRRSRTRQSVTAVRQVFLDADREADCVMDAIRRRSDLPAPSYVLRSSKGRAHVLWRVDGLSIERAERLQRYLAREVGTDLAATSAAQMTRLPGFFNHKYAPPPVVNVQYGAATNCWTALSFPSIPAALIRRAQPVRAPLRQRMPMVDRARRYLAATPPATAGRHGDIATFRVCCRLVHTFGLTDAGAVEVLREWNGRCLPPWSEVELFAKVRSARRAAVR